MGETLSSICFQENNVSWVQVEVNPGQSVVVKKAVESPLPFIINYDNIQKPTTALQIANHLNSLALSHELSPQNVRFVLSARFALVKKIRVDHAIPESEYIGVTKAELRQLLTGKLDEYLVYPPQYLRENGASRELLSVSLRKEVFQFVQQIEAEANLSATKINLNCFTIDNFYRRFFPNLRGQALLVNFTERGFELILSDELRFLNFSFKPYSKSLQNIDQLDEQEILASFSAVVDDLQHPEILEMPLYAISHIFLFGNYLKLSWLNSLKEQFRIPVRILDPAQSTEWHIQVDDENFRSLGSHRFIEPLSNIF